MDNTPNLSLPYILAAQAQKHVTHNEAIRLLDAVVQLAVINRTLTSPPGSPIEGDRYIIASAATGAWASFSGQIAAFQDGTWTFYGPKAGWQAWVIAEAIEVAFNGTGWIVASASGTMPQLGINATADGTNRLTVASTATLLSHDGHGHQLKINKAAAGETASLLLQDNFSGRAEIGLSGDDDVHVKVSPDGAAWTEALRINRTSGLVTMPNTPASALPVATATVLGGVKQGTNVAIAANGTLSAAIPVIGAGAGAALTTGTGNVLLGLNAGAALTTGSHAVAAGEQALAAQQSFAPSYIDSTGSNTNLALGPYALASTQVSWGNIALGRNALKNLSNNPSTVALPDYLTANYNVAIGDQAGEAMTTGAENMLVGNHTGLSITTGSVNSAFGSETLKQCSTGIANSAFGVSALQGLTTGSQNTAVGNGAGGVQLSGFQVTTGSFNTFLGANAVPNAAAQHSYMTVIGAQAAGDRDNTIYLGRPYETIIIGGAGVTTTAGLSIGAGLSARAHLNLGGANAPATPVAGDVYWNGGDLTFCAAAGVTHKLNSSLFYLSPTTGGFTGGGNMFIGRNAGNTTLAPATANGQASNNTAIGNGVGQGLTTGIGNTLVGSSVGSALTTAISNTFIGQNTGNAATTAVQNTVVGQGSYTAAATGYGNALLGYNAGTAMTSGVQNTVLGSGSGNSMAGAFGNTVVGSSSAGTMTGSTNVVVGYSSGGGLTSGAGNTILGAGLNGLTGSLANTAIIGAGGAQLIVADATSVRPQKPLGLPSFTVATLPAASAALKGACAYVTDAVAPVWLAALTGGGTVVCPVFCNGTAWVAG